MLKGIDPVLGPELLAILRGMGHGDEIAVVDGNYPAETDAKKFALAVLNPAKLSKLCKSLRFNSLLWLPSVRNFSRLAFLFEC